MQRSRSKIAGPGEKLPDPFERSEFPATPGTQFCKGSRRPSCRVSFSFGSFLLDKQKIKNNKLKIAKRFKGAVLS